MEQLRPFHETIILAIRRTTTDSELEHLGEFIRATVIPDNHNAIADAWRVQSHHLLLDDLYNTATSILAQKPRPMTHEEVVEDALDRR